ncbi:MAG: transposase [Phyllobacteriaceae bacterium]|nr:transposase [Phyllobacteriaceae bacterium]
MQYGFAESFNGRMRDGLLNETLYFDLDDSGAKTAVRVADFDTARHTRRSDTSRPRPMPPTSPQQAIGCAIPTGSADRLVLQPRHTA